MFEKWSKEIGVGITVCDTNGMILWLNDLAVKIFAKSGGIRLIGKNLLECHPGHAKQKIIDLFEKKQPYCYTVDIKGVAYMLFQSPWHEDGRFMGFVEFIHTVPAEVPQLEKIHWVEEL